MYIWKGIFSWYMFVYTDKYTHTSSNIVNLVSLLFNLQHTYYFLKILNSDLLIDLY